MTFLIDFFSDYDHVKLDSKYKNMTIFIISLGLFKLSEPYQHVRQWEVKAECRQIRQISRGGSASPFADQRVTRRRTYLLRATSPTQTFNHQQKYFMPQQLEYGDHPCETITNKRPYCKKQRIRQRSSFGSLRRF